MVAAAKEKKLSGELAPNIALLNNCFIFEQKPFTAEAILTQGTAFIKISTTSKEMDEASVISSLNDLNTFLEDAKIPEQTIRQTKNSELILEGNGNTSTAFTVFLMSHQTGLALSQAATIRSTQKDAPQPS